MLEARDGSRFRIPSLRDSIGFHLFVDGVYEPEAIQWVVTRLRLGEAFLDVGANIGAFTVPAARQVGPSGRVVAIEASPSVGATLIENVQLNALSNVSVFNVAASAHSGPPVQFFEAPIQKFGSGALTPNYGGHAVSVPRRTVDEILAKLSIRRIAVMKVDVEGFEADVFRGAQALLRGENPPVILFEYYDWAEKNAGQPGDAQRLLREWGYDIWTFEDFKKGRPPLEEPATGSDGGTLLAIPADRATEATHPPKA
jgi:FkbM family methyltransferase